MKKIGIMLLLDSVSSMSRDRVNFEDRVLSSIKYKNKDKKFFSRTISSKTAPSCLDLLRKRSSDYKQFINSMDEVRAYVVLGLAEENHTITKKWFDTTIHHLIDELLFMNIEPCIVSCRKKSNQIRTEMTKVSDGRKKVYTSKQNWNYTSCYSLNVISKQRNIDIIKCDIACKNQWDTLSIQSIRNLTKYISDDLHYYINN